MPSPELRAAPDASDPTLLERARAIVREYCEGFGYDPTNIENEMSLTPLLAAALAEERRVTVEQCVQEDWWLSFLQRKYVQRADSRQAAMGLSYTEAETRDLAREICNAIRALSLTAKEPQG